MFEGLKDLILSNKEKNREKLIPISHSEGMSKTSTKSSPAPALGVFGYIENGVLHDYREVLDLGENSKQIKQQWFSSVNNGKGFPKMYKSSYEAYDEKNWEVRRENIKLLSEAKDEETLRMYREYMFGGNMNSNDVNRQSVIIAGDVSKEIIGKLYAESDRVKFAALEENLDEDYIPFPVARLTVVGKDPIDVKGLLNSDNCKKYGIDAVTICAPDENKTRGVRLVLCQSEEGQEVRTYEVINGTYQMSLNWEVEGKECKMEIEINADGSAKILKRNGVTDEQIFAHTEVMVGKQHEVNYLYEALGLGKGKSTERIYPSLSKRSNPKVVKETPAKEDAKIKQLVEKDPEVKSALKEFASEVKEESSESMKPLTKVAKLTIEAADTRAASPAPSTTSITSVATTSSTVSR